MSDETKTVGKNLHQRMVEVMRTMGAIGKGGKANYDGNYLFHKIDDIDDELRKALVEHGVVAVVTEIRDRKLEGRDTPDKYGNARTTWNAECLVNIELFNADNPEDKMSIVGWGQGLDFGDKATGKAIAYALKTAYLSAFHLRGQPDNEADNPASPIPTVHPSASAKPTSKPVAPKPVKKPLPDYDSLSEKGRELVNAIRQTDTMKDLEAMRGEFMSEPEEVRDFIVPFFEEHKKTCWALEINRCETPDALRAVGAKIAKDGDKDLHAALQSTYAIKLKSFMPSGPLNRNGAST